MGTDKMKGGDPFYKHNFFDDPELIFGLKNASIDDIKNDCVFVLDTNALFIPYRAGKNSLVEIDKVLKNLKAAGRLVIPAQVAKEFAINRPDRLKEIHQQISSQSDSVKNVELSSFPILEGNKEYQKAQEIQKEINNKIKEFRKSLISLRDEVENWNWDDQVSQMYAKIITKDVIRSCALSDQDISQIHEERYRHKIPPGYKDGSKDDGGHGDLIIWLTILELAMENKNIIFVTSDEKPDWYHQSNKAPLYPRFELVYEFKLKSPEKKNFHIARLSDMLRILGEAETIVDEVKEIELKEIITNEQDKKNHYIEAIKNSHLIYLFHYLGTKYEIIFSNNDDDEFDIIIVNNKIQIFSRILYFTNSNTNDIVKKIITNINEMHDFKGVYTNYSIIVVGDARETNNTVYKLRFSAVKKSLSEYSNVLFLFGVIKNNPSRFTKFDEISDL